MKKEIGAIAKSIQRVGISFTLIQNIVNIPSINKILSKSKTPIKLSLETLDPYEHIYFIKYKKEKTIRPTPIIGIYILIKFN